MRVRGIGAPAGPLPPSAGLRPMHPMAARELPADQAGWGFEPKWNGHRALGHMVAGGLAAVLRPGRPRPGAGGRRRVGELPAPLVDESPFATLPTAA